MTLRIGISARLLHRPPEGVGLPRKRLQFLESNMAQWIMSHGVVALMIPFVDKSMIGNHHPPVINLVQQLDGLVLQGGTDISPRFYGAEPWTGHGDYDTIRDEYELELLDGFIKADKPVLGVCRGCQLINVYFGGSLVQDIPTQWPGAIEHLDDARYEQLFHEVHFLPGSRLAKIYGHEPRHVNSIHHQCIDELGTNLVLEARSPVDRVPEGIRHTRHRFVMGVQWHPEFQLGVSPENPDRFDSGPLMMDFLKAAQHRASPMRRISNRIGRVRERTTHLSNGKRGTNKNHG